MPLGDPHGGLFEYTDEGLPGSIFACTVPVRDVNRSIGFYRDILGMEVLSSDDSVAYLRRDGCRVILRRSDVVGIDTGLYLGVDSPYNTYKYPGLPVGPICCPGMESIRAAVYPNETDYYYFAAGTYTSFRDDDGNVIHCIETGAEFRI